MSLCNRGRAFVVLLDERDSEAQNASLKLRIYVKWPAFCEESNGASEDVRTRKRDCLIRTFDCKESKQQPTHEQTTKM
eukprot:8073848-Heterocapsa_arctica.AAC.1